MIFISHSTHDKKEALHLHRLLLEKGYEAKQLFLDSEPESGIPPGDDWKQTIYARLRDCAAMIALCSARWKDSRWCFAELTYAEMEQKPLFPVALDEEAIGALAAQAVFPRKDDRAYERLLKALEDRHLGPKDLPANVGARPTDPRHYARVVKEVSIPEGQIGSRLSITVSPHLLAWSALRKLPPPDEFDAIFGGTHTVEARDRLRGARASGRAQIVNIESRRSEIKRNADSVESRIRDIEHESTPRQPSRGTPDPWLNGEQLWKEQSRLQQRYTEDVARYERELGLYRERQQQLPSLRAELASWQQQAAQIAAQLASLEVALDASLRQLEDAVRQARGRDLVELLTRLRDAARKALADAGTTPVGFFALLTAQCLAPLFRPWLLDSWGAADGVAKDVEQRLEEATKAWHRSVCTDFFARWLDVQRAMRRNEAELARLRGVLAELPALELAQETRRAQRILGIELPAIPNISKLRDPKLIPGEAAVLVEKRSIVEQARREGRALVEESVGLREQVSATRQRAETIRSEIAAQVARSTEALEQISLLSGLMTSAMGATALPEHTKAFLSAMAEEADRRLGEKQGALAARCHASRFCLGDAEETLATHGSALLLDALRALEPHLAKMDRHLDKLDEAGRKLENKPMQLYKEHKGTVDGILAFSFIPGLQLFAALKTLCIEEDLTPALQSPHPKLVPLRRVVLRRVGYSAVISSAMAAAVAGVLAHLWRAHPQMLSLDHDGIVWLCIAGAGSALSAILFWRAWALFRKLARG